MDIERRIAAAPKLMNAGKKPQIAGYAAVFNRMSQDLGGFKEIILPGAFDAVLRSAPDVVALFNHDSNQILGRTSAGTLELSTDAQGLWYTITPPESRKDILESIERGDVTGSSFAFTIPKDGDEWRSGDDGKPVRHVRTIGRLFDVGPVVSPAYADTTAAKRSLAAIADQLGMSLDEARRRIRILELK